MTSDSFEDVRQYLPKYLSPTDSRELFSALASYPDLTDYYLAPDSLADDILQGDGWKSFVAINFETLERRMLAGIVISNSCDIDLANPRAGQRRILFSPLVSLRRYITLLEKSGFTKDRIDSQLQDIRRQRVTYLFYLPSLPYGPDESIALLDDLHTQPLQSFLESQRTRTFRLNQAAWYVFLIKLSIHFSRANEGVRRMGPSKD